MLSVPLWISSNYVGFSLFHILLTNKPRSLSAPRESGKTETCLHCTGKQVLSQLSDLYSQHKATADEPSSTLALKNP